jgi:hypothetical protein
MEVVAALLALVCYGLALFFWQRERKRIFLFALFSGHVGALAAPLWSMLYGSTYQPGMPELIHLFGEPLPMALFLASAWFYPLPALVVLYLYYARWWAPGYITALITYGAFIFYHTIFESLGLRLGLWHYQDSMLLPFGLSGALLSTLMAALISFILLYVLLLVRRFAWLSMLITLLPATLLASLLVRGILGGPLWVSLTINDLQEWVLAQDWVVQIGVVGTLALIIWAAHIVARSLSQIEWDLI